MRTLFLLCTVLASVTAITELPDIDLVVVVDDSSRLREFKAPRGDRLLSALIHGFVGSIAFQTRSRIGLTTYNDKSVLPYMPFGDERVNYCSKRRLSLQDDMLEFGKELDNIEYGAQASAYEEMTDAHAGLMEAMNPEMGWRKSTKEKPVLHVIVLVAGARPREPGPGVHHTWGNRKYNPNNGDFNLDCLNEDYYSSEQVLSNMRKLNVVPYVFTWWGFSGPYRTMVQELQRGRVDTFRADVRKVLLNFFSEAPRLLETLSDEEGEKTD